MAIASIAFAWLRQMAAFRFATRSSEELAVLVLIPLHKKSSYYTYYTYYTSFTFPGPQGGQEEVW